MPLFLQSWQGTHYSRTTLHHLGQLVLLTPCSHRQNAEVEDQVTLTVIHTNGIHSITFIRCHCATCPSITKAQLLLRHRLWPGSVVNPKTVTRWARAGKLNAIRTLGGHRRFKASEIRACLEEMSQSEA